MAFLSSEWIRPGNEISKKSHANAFIRLGNSANRKKILLKLKKENGIDLLLFTTKQLSWADSVEKERNPILSLQRQMGLQPSKDSSWGELMIFGEG